MGLHAVCQVCAQLTIAAWDIMMLCGDGGSHVRSYTTTVGEWLDRVEKKSCHLCYLLFHDMIEWESKFRSWEPSTKLMLTISVYTTAFRLLVLSRGFQRGEAWKGPKSARGPILIHNSAWDEGMLAPTMVPSLPFNSSFDRLPDTPWPHLVHPMLCGGDLERCNSTLSASTVAKIHQWLFACKTEHGPQCSQAPAPGQNRFLPKRLVDVSPRPRDLETARPLRSSDIDRLSIDADPAIQLVLADGLPSDIEYLTLSHCWGQHGPSIQLKEDTQTALLSGNIRDFEKPFQDFLAPGSRTIRDAIHITRCLGFKYIWIDALCINQGPGDPDGKKAEIARMHHIYRGAALNLSAAGARDGTEGMIFERDILVVAPCVQRLGQDDSVNDGGTDGTLRTQLGGDCVAYYREDPIKAVSSTISSRGWVYQERLLSPRTVYFSREQVYWECPNFETSEFHPCRPCSTTSDGRDHFKARFKSLIAPGLGVPRNLAHSDAKWPNWSLVCQGYASTTVSVPSDRAVAFSAIARSVAEGAFADPQQYVAGFWKERLLKYLGWHRSNSQQGQHQSGPLLPGAPSWSWLSRHGSIYIPGALGEMKKQFCAEVLEVDVQTETIGDPFSASLSGRIRISGPVLKVPSNLVTARNTHDAQPATGTFKHTATGIRRGAHGDNMHIFWDSTTDEEQGWREIDKSELYFFALSRQYDFWSSGLLLTRSSSDRAGYSRVGFCQYHSDREALRKGLRPSKHLLPLMKGHSHLDDDDNFLERHDDGTYVIEIW